MQTFKFNIDRKCTIWAREHHEIQASTYEEAEHIMKRCFEDDDTCGTFIEQEFLYDTIQDMTIEDNFFEQTAELINEEGNAILDNTISEAI